MKIKGYRILVKPDDIHTQTKSGIIVVLDERMEMTSQQFGVVVDVGPTCWTDSQGNALERWCEAGDRVLFSKHAGRFFTDPDDPEKKELLIINDTDIIGVCNNV